MGRPAKYPEEFRREAVELYREGPPVVRSPRLGGDHDRKQSGAATGTASAFVHR